MILRYLIFLLITISLSSCESFTKLGDVTVVSTRNFDSKTDYVELRRYVRGLGKKTKDANAFEAAVNEAVKQVPGGEFLKNCKIYVNGTKIKVEGDVWGVAGQAVQLKDKHYEKIVRQKQKAAYKAAKDSLK